MRSATLNTHRRKKHGRGQGIQALVAASLLAGTLAVAFFFFATDARVSGTLSPRPPQSAASAEAQTRDGEQQRRMAAILFPYKNDTCEKRRFDNRTGRIEFGGIVDCKAEMDREDPASVTDLRDNTVRIRAILDAFKK